MEQEKRAVGGGSSPAWHSPATDQSAQADFV